MYPEKWGNARNKWVRASDLSKRPLSNSPSKLLPSFVREYRNSAPGRTLYYRAAVILLVNIIMWFAILYIVCVMTYHICLLIWP